MSSSESNRFIAADIAYFDDTDLRLVGRRARSENGEIVEQLAGFFPELGSGRRSPTSGGWMPRIQIMFERPDHSLTTVRVKRDLTCWNEGKGDWFTLKPGLEPTVVGLVPKTYEVPKDKK